MDREDRMWGKRGTDPATYTDAVQLEVMLCVRVLVCQREVSFPCMYKCVCPSESAVDGAMPIPSLQIIPSGSKLIGAAMLRLCSDNDHKHSG